MNRFKGSLFMSSLLKNVLSNTFSKEILKLSLLFFKGYKVKFSILSINYIFIRLL